jgi:conjugal transfer pilus assembly protein TraW
MNAYMALVFLSHMDTFPRQSVIGQTYPIEEDDALSEIEAKAEATPFDRSQVGPPETWSSFDSKMLPPSPVNSVRMVTPLHQLGFGIPDHNGEILYPAGFTFNPLEHATLPGRIIVTDPSRIEWALSEASAIDMVLVAGAHPDQILGRPGRSIFLLGDMLAERLGVTHAPTIIRQVGVQLELSEIRANDVPRDDAQPSVSGVHAEEEARAGE